MEVKNPEAPLSKFNTFFLGVIAIILVGFILRPMSSIMVPLLVSVFIFMLLKPLMIILKKKKIPNFIAVMISLTVILIVMTLFMFVIYASLSTFVKEFPTYEKKIEQLYLSKVTEFERLYFDTINKFGIQHEDVKHFNWEGQLSSISFTGIIASLFGSVFNFITNFFLIVLVLIYLLISEGSIERKAKFFSTTKTDDISKFVRSVNHQVYTYLITKTVISFLTGFGSTVLLYFWGVDFPIVWGVLTFLLNYIPNIGSIIATIFPFSLSIVQFGNFSYPMGVLLTLSSLQITMGNIIEPKLVGKNLDMSPVAVIVSLVFWGWLWGIQGMFIGIPITAICKIICENVPSLRFIAVIISNK